MYLDIVKQKQDAAQKVKEEDSSTPISEEFDSGERVWFFVEHRDGKAEEDALKLAGEARNLADRLKGKVSAIIFGSQVKEIPKEFGIYGIDNVQLIEDSHLATYSSDAYVELLAQLIKLDQPSIILFAATIIGNDLAPRLAAKINASYVARYNEINVDKDGNLSATRIIHAGNAQSSISIHKKPLIATIDTQTLSDHKSKVPKITEILEPKANIPTRSGRTTVINYLKANPCAVCVSEAEIVLGIGKGLSSSENLPAVEELAQVLGASIGGSRRATDELWVADERRIGLTGKTITPRLYLICGISGAFHHTLGIKGSKYKISINIDPNAPIAKMSDLMIIGDMQKIIPELTKQLREKIPPTR